jgi:hypothetical protein
LKTARTPLFDDALPTTLRAPHPIQIGEFFLSQSVFRRVYFLSTSGKGRDEVFQMNEEYGVFFIIMYV